MYTELEGSPGLGRLLRPMQLPSNGIFVTGKRAARATQHAGVRLTAFRAEGAGRLRRLLTVAAGCARVASGTAGLSIVLPGEAAAALGRAVDVCVLAARTDCAGGVASDVLEVARSAVGARALPRVLLRGSSSAGQRRDSSSGARTPGGAQQAL